MSKRDAEGNVKAPGVDYMSALPDEIKERIAEFVARPSSSGPGAPVVSQNATFVEIPKNLLDLRALGDTSRAFRKLVRTPPMVFRLMSARQDRDVDRVLKGAKGKLQKIMEREAESYVGEATSYVNYTQHVEEDDHGNVRYTGGGEWTMLQFAEGLSGSLEGIAGRMSDAVRTDRIRAIMARMGLDGLIDWKDGKAVTNTEAVRAEGRAGIVARTKKGLFAWFSTLNGVDYYNLQAVRDLAASVAGYGWNRFRERDETLLAQATSTMNTVRDRLGGPPSLERPFVAMDVGDALKNPNFERLYAPPGATLPPRSVPYVDPIMPRRP